MLSNRQTRTADRATGKWPGILAALGIAPKFLCNRHGPCPICGGGKDRFRFDDLDGRGTWICAACGSGDGFQLLQKFQGWGFKEVAREVDRVVGNVSLNGSKRARHKRSPEQKREAMGRVWADAKPLELGDPVWAYLHGRGIDLRCEDIRYHERLEYWHDGKTKSYHPAMLALVRAADGAAVNVHRTWLGPDGQGKANVPAPRRVMAGYMPPGSAIRLMSHEKRLGIAEGIETAKSASQRFDLPVWSAINTALLETWVPPEGVQAVWIFADADKKYAGQKAAFSLAHRLACKGIAVEVKVPIVRGQDFNDAGFDGHADM